MLQINVVLKADKYMKEQLLTVKTPEDFTTIFTRWLGSLCKMSSMNVSDTCVLTRGSYLKVNREFVFELFVSLLYICIHAYIFYAFQEAANEEEKKSFSGGHLGGLSTNWTLMVWSHYQSKSAFHATG